MSKETIAIKLTLLSLSAKTCEGQGVTTALLIERAKAFEEYITGGKDEGNNQGQEPHRDTK